MYGGIIADPMGLGKTLAILSLVASDAVWYPTETRFEEKQSTKPSVSATLVIVPPPRIATPFDPPVFTPYTIAFTDNITQCSTTGKLRSKSIWNLNHVSMTEANIYTDMSNLDTCNIDAITGETESTMLAT
jgi:hypothetical protein